MLLGMLMGMAVRLKPAAGTGNVLKHVEDLGLATDATHSK
jgi:hypothetical protein